MSDWDDLPDPYYSDKTRSQLLATFVEKYPWRMMILQHYFHWLQRKMTNMGLNPEDARYLL